MSNLRPVTDGENTYNRTTNNKTGYRGVTYRKSRNTYKAVIYYKNEIFYSKSYKSAEQAAFEYNMLALKYYGNKAILNKLSNKIEINFIWED
jgi:hypothetical protein